MELDGNQRTSVTGNAILVRTNIFLMGRKNKTAISKRFPGLRLTKIEISFSLHFGRLISGNEPRLP